MSFVLGGLLQGLGQGIQNEVKQRRENALLALKRQQDDADYARTRADKLADYDRVRTDNQLDADLEATRKEGLLVIAGKNKVEEIRTTGEENRKTRATDYAYDVKLETVRSTLRTQESNADAANARALEKLKAQLDPEIKDPVTETKVAEDGSLILIHKSGKRVKDNSGVKFAVDTKGGGEDEGSIAAARAGRDGKPAPAANKPAPTKQGGDNPQLAAALSATSMAWQRARNEPEEMRRKYPAMFNPDGSLKSHEELIAAVRQRYAR